MSKIYDALQHLEAQRKAMESGEAPSPAINPLDLQEHPTAMPPPAAAPMAAAPMAAARTVAQNLLEQAASVTRFGAELQRRMSDAGLNGVQGLFALADQLHRALATVSQPELDGAAADLDRVAERIRVMKDDLHRLKTVKTDLEGLGFPKS